MLLLFVDKLFVHKMTMWNNIDHKPFLARYSNKDIQLSVRYISSLSTTLLLETIFQPDIKVKGTVDAFSYVAILLQLIEP